MCGVAPTARPSCGAIPSRAAPVRPDARGVLARDPSVCLAAVEEFAVPRGKRTKRARSNVEARAEASTVGGEMPVDPALDLLHSRMASELEALRELVKKAELISRGPACKRGAAPAGKRKRIVAAEPRPEAQIEAEDGGKMQSVKRRKMSPPLDQNQMEAPRMSPDEREQLAGRLASLAAVPGHIVEFLQQRFGGDADPQGEIEIDVDRVEDSVLLELKTLLDKFAEESLGADAVLPKEEHGSVTMDLDPKTQMDSNLAEVIRSAAIPEQDEEDVDICSMSDSDSDSSSSTSSSDSDGSTSSSDSDSESDSDEVVSSRSPPAFLLPEENGTSAQPPPGPAPEALQSTEQEIVPGDGVDTTAPPALLPEENVVIPAEPPPRPASEVATSAEQTKVRGVQRAAPKAVCIPGAIFRAKVRRELMEMDRAVLPDESIHPRDLEDLCIAEYGRRGIMRQLGLFLKADA